MSLGWGREVSAARDSNPTKVYCLVSTAYTATADNLKESEEDALLSTPVQLFLFTFPFLTQTLANSPRWIVHSMRDVSPVRVQRAHLYPANHAKRRQKNLYFCVLSRISRVKS